MQRATDIGGGIDHQYSRAARRCKSSRRNACRPGAHDDELVIGRGVESEHRAILREQCQPGERARPC